MNTIILNGSPKAKNGNSEIFAQQFIKGMSKPCEIKYIAKEDPKLLAQYVKDFDTIILVLPLYIHAMPGIVMRFIEHLEPCSLGDKSIGFILQCGFSESSQCKYVERYFCSLAQQLNCTYLGTAMKGNAAGTYMMPEFMTRKTFKLLNDLGRIYEQTHTLDKSIIEKMQQPYELKGFNLKYLQFATKIGLTKIIWHKFLKDNNALDKKLDKPFI